MNTMAYNPSIESEPGTLCIYMRRGERRIADEINRQFGGFKQVVIDVDGQQFKFSADSFIKLLEIYEGGTR